MRGLNQIPDIHLSLAPRTLADLQTSSILILTAVQMETRAVLHALGDRGYRFYTVGIGAKHLPSTEQLKGISLIILCGVAGALDPSLKIGDVILDDSGFCKASIQRGKIHTAAKIIATPAQKAELFQKTGALAVDMEQATVQALADKHQIPLIVLRAISDTASEILNPKVVQFVDDLGRPKAIKIALGLVGQPTLIPYLLWLNANTKFALLRLTEALKIILEEGKPQ